jgi:vesicle coat complex subunit
MSVCTFFLKPSDSPPNLEELKTRMATGTLEERTAAVKDLIKSMANDETYPPIIMHIITNIIPQQHKSNELRKVMLLYW